MKLPELKSVIKEIIAESVFGVKLKIMFNDNLRSALISKNTRSTYDGEDAYRLTWFEPKTMEPLGHMDFSENYKDYILTKKELPMGLKIKYFRNGMPIPRLIFEGIQPMKTANYILVGTVTEDGEVIAKYGGSHAIHGMRSDYNWRYNPYSGMIYWHNPHPATYENWVKDYIERKGNVVSWQITLSNISDRETYDNLWRDAHGLD